MSGNIELGSGSGNGGTAVDSPATGTNNVDIFTGSGQLVALKFNVRPGSASAKINSFRIDGSTQAEGVTLPDPAGSWDSEPTDADNFLDYSLGTFATVDGECTFTFNTPIDVTTSVNVRGETFQATAITGGGGGSATTIGVDGAASFSGIVTATSFSGDVSGSISGATGAFTGNVSVGGELRDGDGNFGTSGQVLSSDGTDTAWVNAGSLTAGAAALVGVTNTGANASHYIAFVEANSGNEEVRVDTDLVYNPSTNVLTASSFAGDLTGDVTGNVSGSSGSCTGNAATATLATNAAGLTGTPDITVGEIIGTDLTLSGDLTVNGTTTTLNTATLEVEDLNITVAKNAASSAAADGAGLTVAGASATFNYSHSGTKWVANKAIEAPNFNATSDITLKDNVSIIDNALEMINNLEGINGTGRTVVRHLWVYLLRMSKLLLLNWLLLEITRLLTTTVLSVFSSRLLSHLAPKLRL